MTSIGGKKKFWMGKKPNAVKLDSLLLASSTVLDRTIDKVVKGRFHFVSVVHVALKRHPL